MTNYETLIYDNFLGDTPKEKYEDMLLMQKERNKYKSKIENLKAFFVAINGAPDDATLGNLRSIINSFETTIFKDVK